VTPLPKLFGAIALIASAISPAAVDQRLYRETEDGWFIYVEDRSCVMYADYEEGAADLMLRFSARTDENRIYFTVVSSAWERLTPRIGATGMIMLEFPELKQALAAVMMVIRNGDSRMGYTANDFTIEEMERLVATGGKVAIKVMLGDGPLETVADLSLDGGAVATMHLAQCTEENFPVVEKEGSP
jgi:hypothetical protein